MDKNGQECSTNKSSSNVKVKTVVGLEENVLFCMIMKIYMIYILGYYCTSGVNTATPNTNFTGTGGVCPIGNRCPVGSVNPDPCPAGTYNDMTGQADCLICPEGYYCLNGADSFSSNTCPFGKHVNTGTRETSTPLNLELNEVHHY